MLAAKGWMGGCIIRQSVRETPTWAARGAGVASLGTHIFHQVATHQQAVVA